MLLEDALFEEWGFPTAFSEGCYFFPLLPFGIVSSI